MKNGAVFVIRWSNVCPYITHHRSHMAFRIYLHNIYTHIENTPTGARRVLLGQGFQVGHEPGPERVSVEGQPGGGCSGGIIGEIGVGSVCIFIIFIL